MLYSFEEGVSHYVDEEGVLQMPGFENGLHQFPDLEEMVAETTKEKAGWPNHEGNSQPVHHSTKTPT
jgi:hypothetical protein